ncbi:MAG: hypothetical protein FJX03_05650 [Alphaproteobacteria bacterium]|nr:hypothetical protein [Alphaproteobacteria bacterium]
MMSFFKKWCCLVLSISMMVSTIAPTWAVKISHHEQFFPSSSPSTAPLKECVESYKIQEKPLSQPLPKYIDSASQNSKPTRVAFANSSNPLLSFVTFACAHPLQALMFLFLMQESFFKCYPLVKVPGVAAGLSVSGLNQNLTWNGVLGSPVLLNSIVVYDTIPEEVNVHYDLTLTLSDITAGNLTCNGTTSLQPSFIGGVWSAYGLITPVNDLLLNCKLLYIPLKSFFNLTIAGKVLSIEPQEKIQGNITITNVGSSLSTGSSLNGMTTPSASSQPSSSSISASSLGTASTIGTSQSQSGTSNQNSSSSTENSNVMSGLTDSLSNGFSPTNDSFGTSLLSNNIPPTNPMATTTNSLLNIMNSSQDKSAMIIGSSVGGCVILTGAIVALIVGYKRQWCGLNSSAKQSLVQDKALESGQSKQYASLGLYHNLPQGAGQSDTTNYSKPPAPDSFDQSPGGLYTNAPIAPAGSPQGNGVYTSAPLAPANSNGSGQNPYIACDAPLTSPLNNYDRLTSSEAAYVECGAPLE